MKFLCKIGIHPWDWHDDWRTYRNGYGYQPVEQEVTRKCKHCSKQQKGTWNPGQLAYFWKSIAQNNITGNDFEL